MKTNLLNEAYICINALLSDAYRPLNGALSCTYCLEVSPLHVGESSFTPNHEEGCLAGKAISLMRKIEASYESSTAEEN